jgi:hypothetical protein
MHQVKTHIESQLNNFSVKVFRSFGLNKHKRHIDSIIYVIQIHENNQNLRGIVLAFAPVNE